METSYGPVFLVGALPIPKACSVNQTWLPNDQNIRMSVRNTVIIFGYMHIFNFLFNILLSPFLTIVLLLFSTEDMSRNDT